MDVTVTGGAGKPPLTLHYDAAGAALTEAQALAGIIDTLYSNQTPVYYQPGWDPKSAVGQYVVITSDVADNDIIARGAAFIVDENDGPSTIEGGGSNPQVVLASDGGLTFYAKTGAVTVVAGGGENVINVKGDTSNVAIYLADGDNTVYGGDGDTTISAGIGDNRVVLGDGHSTVDVTGTDTVLLGAGSETIDVLGSGSALIRGAHSVSGSGYSLTFIGGSSASTVRGGAGKYDIQGGAGGGHFHGGTGGDNSIIGGSGSVTIVGGGAGDTLEGGSASDLIKAGLGNETLGGGGGDNLFNLTKHDNPGTTGVGTTDTIMDFNTNDLLSLGGSSADTYALDTFTVVGSNGQFYLLDGTKVVLDGFTSLAQDNFKN